jgi:NitT/TauT family transport system substrate-binding protein
MKFLGARLAVALCLLGFPAFAADKVSFGTNWLAEAEHGGYY